MALVGVVALSAIPLTACSVDELPPVPSVAPLSESQSEALAASILEEKGGRILSLYPGAVLPTPDRVRFVTQSEIAHVKADCVTEQGFPAHPNDEGGITYSPVPPDEQAEAQTLAAYACDVMYPLDPRFIRPYTEAELRYIYAYQKHTVIPCIEQAGSSASALPSEQVFIEDWENGRPWIPYGDDDALTMEEASEIPELCPMVPAELHRQ
ncbi:hypothetical protein ASE14_02450 [Agromyces sp. Root81]|uniref:hypothetical protein n=1 Tax=Agromyces sp. Root81 TaxID=1736601 RepID=UPI0006F83A18|nr:hypothetical protein [Agromyces sp. Root81]KRC62702.1 hypothetical protein ASE14_02450 [Agromyces sp. Root81]